MTDFYTITINGVDLLVDAEDADFMGRYQSAYNELAAKPPVFAGLPDNARVYDSIFETLLQKIMEQRMAAVLRLAEAKKRYAAR